MSQFWGYRYEPNIGFALDSFRLMRKTGLIQIEHGKGTESEG
jgi:hypothetical protein